MIDVAALGLNDAAEVLLRHGANPNATSATRDNALNCAVRAGNVQLVALLLEAGADGRYLTDLGESVFDALPPSGDERRSMLEVLEQHGLRP